MNKLGKIKTLTIASLSAIALATPIALAQSGDQNSTSSAQAEQGHKQGRGWGHRGGRGGRRGHGKGFRGGMFRAVNLTEDQKTRMKQIRVSFHSRTQGLRQELRAKRQELRQASEGGTFNEALATQKLQETAGLQAKLMGERFKLRQEMLAVLTDEQKAQIEQKRAEFKARRAQRGQPNIQ